MLTLSEPLLRRIEEHAQAGYPAEVCGHLLGVDGEVRRVTEVRQATNLLQTATRDRYEVDPQDTLRADREARDRGEEVLGFYHSHPDHPAVPSAFDKARAWPWYSYLILSISSETTAARAWRLEGESMVEDTLTIISPETGTGG